MTTDTHRGEWKPPKLGFVVAVLLELAMMSDMARHRAWVGLVCWVVYFRFSATCSALFASPPDQGG